MTEPDILYKFKMKNVGGPDALHLTVTADGETIVDCEVPEIKVVALPAIEGVKGGGSSCLNDGSDAPLSGVNYEFT